MISPETPEETAKLKKKLKLDFDILFDPKNQYAEQLDLVHGFPQDLREIYLSFGIDVGNANGNGEWKLPIPSRLVIGEDHTIKSIQSNAAYTQRPEPQETLDFLLAGSHQ